MRNRNELFIVIATVAVLACMVFSVLGVGTGCSDRTTAMEEEEDDDDAGVSRKKDKTYVTVRAKAMQTQCLSNLRSFAQANALYATSFNSFVTPISWGDGVNIWPAIVWNFQNEGVQMPYDDYASGKERWLKAVKNSKMFECPADDDTMSLPDSDSVMPALSYAINRSAVRNMKGSNDAANIPNGPVLRITKFKVPSRMIYVCDTSWNKRSSKADAPGRLYSTKSHPSYGFKPGSICHHWDQGQLAPEFNDGGGETKPWHTNNTWNYSFMDFHAETLRPEQTIKQGQDVKDREPSGFWTWNGEAWGQSAD